MKLNNPKTVIAYPRQTKNKRVSGIDKRLK